jgi:hypothetical protein
MASPRGAATGMAAGATPAPVVAGAGFSVASAVLYAGLTLVSGRLSITLVKPLTAVPLLALLLGQSLTGVPWCGAALRIVGIAALGRPDAQRAAGGPHGG